MRICVEGGRASVDGRRCGWEEGSKKGGPGVEMSGRREAERKPGLGRERGRPGASVASPYDISH